MGETDTEALHLLERLTDANVVAWFRVTRTRANPGRWELQVFTRDGRFVCRYGDTLAEVTGEVVDELRLRLPESST